MYLLLSEQRVQKKVMGRKKMYAFNLKKLALLTVCFQERTRLFACFFFCYNYLFFCPIIIFTGVIWMHFNSKLTFLLRKS